MYVQSPEWRGRSEEGSGSDIGGPLEFDRLVIELSTRFGDMPAARSDDAIRDALGRIGETLDIDRCTMYQVQPPDNLLINPVGWAVPGIPAVPAPTPAKALFPWAFDRAFAGNVACFSSIHEIPNGIDRESYRRHGTQSAVTVPLAAGGQVLGLIGFDAVCQERRWLPEDVHRLRVVATTFNTYVTRREREAALHTMLAEIGPQRGPVKADTLYLRRETRHRFGTGFIVGTSPAMSRAVEQVRQVAATDSTVLLLGETGTGKELFAEQIHALSARRVRPMVRVNCSAIPVTLMESELYGREKGAFTGALARQIGRFELADRSTIFLDEIGELPQDVQVKLLRVIEERQIERLGSPKSIRVDTRIIAATHRDLERRTADGTFREDLYYRLNVFPIQVPPLRERPEDIPLLVWRFVDEFSEAFGKRIDAISRDSMALLHQYPWPGNIRELRNVVERAMIVADGPQLSLALPSLTSAAARRSVKLVDVEREHIRSVLENTAWRIRGVGGAADRLGLRPTTLETRLAKLGLKRPKQ